MGGIFCSGTGKNGRFGLQAPDDGELNLREFNGIETPSGGRLFRATAADTK